VIKHDGFIAKMFSDSNCATSLAQATFVSSRVCVNLEKMDKNDFGLKKNLNSLLSFYDEISKQGEFIWFDSHDCSGEVSYRHVLPLGKCISYGPGIMMKI
jgi:hypothetical protein